MLQPQRASITILLSTWHAQLNVGGRYRTGGRFLDAQRLLQLKVHCTANTAAQEWCTSGARTVCAGQVALLQPGVLALVHALGEGVLQEGPAYGRVCGGHAALHKRATMKSAAVGLQKQALRRLGRQDCMLAEQTCPPAAATWTQSQEPYPITECRSTTLIMFPSHIHTLAYPMTLGHKKPLLSVARTGRPSRYLRTHQQAGHKQIDMTCSKMQVDMCRNKDIKGTATCARL